MNILRRTSLTRLLLVCALVVALGVSVTALAFSLTSGPVPPAKPLVSAIHDSLVAPQVEGVSADVQFTNHLLDGSTLASLGGSGGGGIAGASASNPLLSGGSGRLWISDTGRIRLELQSGSGDSQLLYDGSTLSFYDASSNTLYRYTLPRRSTTSSPDRRS